MIRIALCTESFLPIVDGVGRVVYQYATYFGQRDYECYVITPMQDAGYRGKFPFELVDFLSVKVPTAPQYETGIALLDLHYVERISEIQLDLVHVHAPGFSGVEGIRLANKFNIPLLGTFHSKYYDDFLRVTHSDVLASLGSRFVADFYARCDEVWTVSEHAAETLRSYGYKGSIAIVQNGSELRHPNSAYLQAAQEAFSLGDRPILLYVGQMDFKKNLQRIVEAVRLMQDHGHSVQLIFTGQGRDRQALEALCRAARLENVIFTGHIHDQDILDGLYMAASLFVFPSLYDTAGLVVQEAAAMGTPSVVVRGSAPAEMVRDGENGLICEDSTESLCRTVEHYLFEMSPAERARIKEQAQKTILKPWDIIMQEVEARYQAASSVKRRKKTRTFPIPLP
jgi:glycosyltransferase involved in cell wall biosynthesis